MTEGLYRIIAIDPGLNRMGVSVLDVDLINQKIYILYAETIDSVKGIRQKPNVGVGRFSERMAKVHYLRSNLESLFRKWQPLTVVYETPFFRRFPQPYEALIQSVEAIRGACVSYSPLVELDGIDPPTVKKAVGAKGDSSKDAVYKAIHALPEIVYSEETRSLLSSLSEHSSDSIAVGYWKIRQMFLEWRFN